LEPNSWPADKVERWPIDRLVPYARNARTHSEAQIEQVAASIREWGWTNPVLVGEDGGIIAGHCRVLAGRQLGLAEVPVMLATGWSEAQKRAYVLADNQLALNAGWNPDLLRLELGDLQGLEFDLGKIGFDDTELASYGIGVNEIPMPFLSDAGRPSFQQMTFTLHDSQVQVVQAAIAAAKAAGPFDGPNENSNGNALSRICEAYGER
jgi:ParB/Sulfiredoxin domain